MTRKHVVVIGAGFSGVATAAALAKGQRAPRVTLIERDTFGEGVAYGTQNPAHLLNVRASNMSLFADRPDDFARWLNDKTGAQPTTFASRKRYGDYIRFALARTARASLFNGGMTRVKGEAIACRAGSGWWHVSLRRESQWKPTASSWRSAISPSRRRIFSLNPMRENI